MVSIAISTVLYDKQAKTRRSFSMKFKHQALNSINDMMLHGQSVRTASAALNLPHFYYKRWRKLVSSADRHISANAIVSTILTITPSNFAPFSPAAYSFAVNPTRHPSVPFVLTT